MATMQLAASVREKVGKEAVKKVRRAGFVPVSLYGHGMKALSLQVGVKDLYAALRTKAGENVVLNLNVEGVKLKESICLIKEIQQNPVSENIDHVDLIVISMTQKIDVKVPLVALHSLDAPGVKEGGVLDLIHHEIMVECLPTAIPDKIEIDVKTMKIGDTIHAKDLKLPEGVKCKFDDEDVIVALHPPMKEVVATEEAGLTAEPEVIEKGKKPAEGEEAAPAAAPAAKKPEK